MRAQYQSHRLRPARQRGVNLVGKPSNPIGVLYLRTVNRTRPESVTDSLQTPSRRRAQALHRGLARSYRVLTTPEVELVLVTNAGIAVVGAGLVWLQFETRLPTLIVGAAAAYVVLFVMLFWANTPIAAGILGGLIAAGGSALIAAALIARWSFVAACCLGAYCAVHAFISTLRGYRSFAEVLRTRARNSSAGLCE